MPGQASTPTASTVLHRRGGCATRQEGKEGASNVGGGPFRRRRLGGPSRLSPTHSGTDGEDEGGDEGA
jgi:hypothetical protein